MLYDFQGIVEQILRSTTPTVPIPHKNPTIRVPRDVGETYYENLRGCIERLEQKFELSEKGFGGYVKSFSARGNPKKLTPLHSFRVSRGRQHCHWATITFRETVRSGGRYSKLEDYDAIRQVVVADVSFKAGDVVMRPEGLQDKIVELFGNIDIDFEDHSLFSRKYFVLSEDEQRVRDNLPVSFRELMAKNPGYIVRLRDNAVLISKDSAIRANTAESLVNLAFEVAECQ